MSAAENIFIHGIGAVSPAGWGVLPLGEALAKGEPWPTRELDRPGWACPFRVRRVPPPSPRPGFLAHPRLRRARAITQFAVAAALEALGDDAAKVNFGSMRLGIVLCVMTGCVNYSRRFYDETLKDPASASPLVFPETVFNAPASHITALLGTHAINYTLVGDPGTFLQGLALGADWMLNDRVDGCLVVGAEEMDWLTADAYRLFERKVVLSEGAGAVYLRPWGRPTAGSAEEGSRRSELSGPFPSWEGSGVGSAPSVLSGQDSTHPVVQLHSITGSHLYCRRQTLARAAKHMRSELPPANPGHLLCDGTQGLRNLDAAELEAWRDWPGSRLSPKRILGEGLAAASAWQCVAAIDTLRQRQHSAATVSVVGCNQQAIGARFVISNPKSQISNPSE
jgi:3-oxoacyl-(acyl-carrier-protein) synthase